MLKNVALILFILSGSVYADGSWAEADTDLKRLSPEVFKELPSNVKRDLSKRGCLVPQCCFNKTPHNVVNGSFVRKGQTDWAVLCSSGRVSSILIYVGASTGTVMAIESCRDMTFLQHMGDGLIMYSRYIGRLPANNVRDIYKRAKSVDIPGDIHDGLVDGFAEKASSIFYYHKGKWDSLPGAD